MLEINGKYTTAVAYTDEIESSAMGQLTAICNLEIMKDAHIRIMPDVHAGAGCVIGTTLLITDNKVIPNFVGVDIGCGMLTVSLDAKKIELPKLDSVITRMIPSGFDIREKPHKLLDRIDLDRLRCVKQINMERAMLSLGTLGGGNHFIEVAKDSEGMLHLIIHSGSRNMGLQIANYYQQQAFEQLKLSKSEKLYAYCQGELYNDYLHDMMIAQAYAQLNRQAIADEIIKGMKLSALSSFSTVHNFISKAADGQMILRKGAVSAQLDETLLIPLNMRDGSLVCKGKGNPDWNYSAPHGAGRLMSRSDAKNTFTVSDYKAAMKASGVYSTSVGRDTLDECPMAYKPMESILSQIGETVTVVDRLIPVYNFKAGKED